VMMFFDFIHMTLGYGFEKRLKSDLKKGTYLLTLFFTVDKIAVTSVE
jgi:hypothetical protein